jgi:hypothetical protein
MIYREFRRPIGLGGIVMSGRRSLIKGYFAPGDLLARVIALRVERRAPF